MRTLLIAGTAAAALLAADGASAGQRVVQRGPGAHVAPMRATPWVGPQQRGPRWGSKVGGRWWGGVNAPGGWNAYRRPTRGWAVPVYWNTPRFYVTDWSAYGLQQPQQGYRWVRYYDDAVLVDARGSVFDTVGDVDWDRSDRYDTDYDDDRVYASDGGYRPLPPPHRDYGADYREPDYAPAPYAPHPYPPATIRGGDRWVSPDGATTVVTSGGGYGGGVTTVTVHSAPVITTTTTEIFEDRVTWSRPMKKKVWKPRRKVVCRCG